MGAPQAAKSPSLARASCQAQVTPWASSAATTAAATPSASPMRAAAAATTSLTDRASSSSATRSAESCLAGRPRRITYIVQGAALVTFVQDAAKLESGTAAPSDVL